MLIRAPTAVSAAAAIPLLHPNPSVGTVEPLAEEVPAAAGADPSLRAAAMEEAEMAAVAAVIERPQCQRRTPDELLMSALMSARGLARTMTRSP